MTKLASQEDHIHYQAAKEAIMAVQKRFPNGVNNQIEHVTKSNLPKTKFTQEMKICNDFLQDIHQRSIQESVNMTASLSTGHCEMFSNYALGYIATTYPEKKAELAYLDVHAFLVIGRNQSSDPYDINTWDENTLICDPWVDQIYPAKCFREKQTAKTIVSYYGLKRLGKNTFFTEHWDTPYLAGDPQIETGPDSRETDRKRIKWYQKEQTIRAHKLSSSLTFFSAPTRKLPTDEDLKITNAFACLTNQMGWSYNFVKTSTLTYYKKKHMLNN